MEHETDGEGGLKKALTETYDVAIVDIMLPKMDGLSLIEELQSQRSSYSGSVEYWECDQGGIPPPAETPFQYSGIFTLAQVDISGPLPRELGLDSGVETVVQLREAHVEASGNPGGGSLFTPDLLRTPGV